LAVIEPIKKVENLAILCFPALVRIVWIKMEVATKKIIRKGNIRM